MHGAAEEHHRDHEDEADNDYRVEGPFTELNFGVVEIDWQERTIAMSCLGADGEVAFSHSMSLDRLR